MKTEVSNSPTKSVESWWNR